MFTKSLTQRSVMKHNFSQVPHADIQRSTFNRDHGYKTTLADPGILYPIFVDEALPGDTFKVNLTAIARLNTPIVPFMDNIFIDYFFFFVPCRLVWENWQKFMGEQTDPGDSTDYTVPTLYSGGSGVAAGLIYDYMGLPPLKKWTINSLPLRCYNLIWNEWFRDENLQDSVTVYTDDGPDDGVYELLRRGKRHDYFTSCLPWPQKGDSIDLPLGDTAPISGSIVGDGTQSPTFLTASDDIGAFKAVTAASTSVWHNGTATSNANIYWNDPNLIIGPGAVADLSSATAATINSLREAFQLQRMLERDARGGTRYTEILKSHFRVTSPDSRLQRPEYLGGGSRPVNIAPVPQTSITDSTPQGNLAAIGYHQAQGIGFTKSFVEHGYILGLASIRADITYQQGINKLWHRSTKYDFYWPALANLGEQEVLNKEIFTQGTTADEEVFGYQERWAEYRYKPSLITGVLRSDHAKSLDVWHLSQDFASLPSLNSDFIEDDPPIDRVVATPDEPLFVFDAFFSCKTTRPMPMYSVPGLIDHF